MKIGVDGISMYTPQIPDWPVFCRVDSGESQLPPMPEEVERYQPQRLPRNERRRATSSVRLTFRLLEDLHEAFPFHLDDAPSVFASSGGDYDVVHRINTALTAEQKFISPTDFHNSVHNAPAGYWSIACSCNSASTSVSAGDATFGAGLLEAALLCNELQKPTVYVAYDIGPPMPLQRFRPIEAPFGVAMLLNPLIKSHRLAQLDIALGEATGGASEDRHQKYAQVAPGNPIACCLPLLSALRSQSGSVVLAGTPNIVVHVEE